MSLKAFKNIILVVLLLCSVNLTAQSKKVWLYQADYNFGLSQYPTALRYYNMVLDDSMGLSTGIIPYEVQLSNQKLQKFSKNDTLKKVSLEDYVNHQIALCYRNSHDYEKAVVKFKSSAEKGSYPDDYYYYANSLMNLGKYDEALKVFETYSAMEGSSDNILQRALNDMTSCVFAKNLKKSDDEIAIKLADVNVFNRGTSSFATTYWGGEKNKLVFSSARDGGVLLDPEKQESQYLLDLYWTEYTDKWEMPHNFGRPLNSSLHEASGVFGKGNTIYFTKWGANDLAIKEIYLAREFGLNFFESQKLDSTVNEPGYQSINPYVTNNGKWLYFSSNKPGGIGGMDIWRIELDSMGNTIGNANNLGKPVNSEYDEVSPFFHDVAKTLYFSSNGHENFGGLDVFKSSFDEDINVYRNPKNLGLPINSTKDDNYFIIADDLRSGFLSSDRDNCLLSDTLYNLCASCYHIYELVLPELKFKISGYAYDKNTNEVIPDTKIDFKDVTFQWEHFSLKTDDNGYYEQDLIQNVEVFLKATKIDYFADAGLVSTVGETESKVYTQDFYLEKIPKGEITIQGIEYDFDKASLRPKSKLILDSLIVFLELNNNISIEIRSHTDQRGGDDYNLKLSKRRAQSVVDYLISRGIKSKRLLAKGFGETKPAEVPNENGEMVIMTQEYIDALSSKAQQKEAYQRNRRTAFKVVSQELK